MKLPPRDPLTRPDFKGLSEALSKIQDVAKKINDSKRMAENANLMLEISEKLALDDLVQPFRCQPKSV